MTGGAEPLEGDGITWVWIAISEGISIRWYTSASTMVLDVRGNSGGNRWYCLLLSHSVVLVVITCQDLLADLFGRWVPTGVSKVLASFPHILKKYHQQNQKCQLKTTFKIYINYRYNSLVNIIFKCEQVTVYLTRV